MKVSTILDHIDSGHVALPKFQRGYVWNRDQVRGFMDALYHRHPVGSLLVWATDAKGAAHRGGSKLPPGVVKLLLDGQQRITTLYGIIRGRPPEFFDGQAGILSGLFFHLETEEFSYYMASRMKGDALWIDVTRVMREGIGPLVKQLSQDEAHASRLADYVNRLTSITGMRDVDLHVEEVTGPDKTVEVVVGIFNRVNSGGTKLSKGDLALAKVCAEWADGREIMRRQLAEWEAAGFGFDLDWLLRNVNTVLTGEARFEALDKITQADVRGGLDRAVRACNFLLNLIGSRLGLDHDRVLFGRYAFPVLAHYVDRRGGRIKNALEQDRLLYWYLHSAMWGRFSGSTETLLNRDLELIREAEGGLDRLLDELRTWRGDLKVQPEHFSGWGLGARFYPVLYLLTRVGHARDLLTGVELRKGLLGRTSRLEVHHVFPRALLYRKGYKKDEVNSIANFCFLTRESNEELSDRAPELYFEECDCDHKGVLSSQWIPTDRALWKPDNYVDFLQARRAMLARAANGFLSQLLQGKAELLRAADEVESEALNGAVDGVPSSVADDAEWQALEDCNAWVAKAGLPKGQRGYEVTDDETGEAVVLDLVWPRGLQRGLSQPVAVLINEGPEVHAAAALAGYKCFATAAAFRKYVEREILGGSAARL